MFYCLLFIVKNGRINPLRAQNGSRKRKLGDETENDSKMANGNENNKNSTDNTNDNCNNDRELDPPAAKKAKIMAQNKNGNMSNAKTNGDSENKVKHDFSLGNLGTPLNNKKKVNNRPRSLKNKQLAKVNTKGMKSMMSYFGTKKK